MYFVLVFDEGLRAVDFSIMKNPTASVGSEPAILGSRGHHRSRFEPTIAAGERPYTYTLDRAATGTGNKLFHTFA
jgi:hypothetical protein